MQLPSWLTFSRRARRNRRRLPLVPVSESLEDRTLLSLLWAYDSGTGHLEFTTDDPATTIVVQDIEAVDARPPPTLAEPPHTPVNRSLPPPTPMIPAAPLRRM